MPIPQSDLRIIFWQIAAKPRNSRNIKVPQKVCLRRYTRKPPLLCHKKYLVTVYGILLHLSATEVECSIADNFSPKQNSIWTNAALKYWGSKKSKIIEAKPNINTVGHVYKARELNFSEMKNGLAYCSPSFENNQRSSKGIMQLTRKIRCYHPTKDAKHEIALPWKQVTTTAVYKQASPTH